MLEFRILGPLEVWQDGEPVPTLRARGSPHQLIVTTNYDLALERAFLEAGEEFDVELSS